MTPTRCHCRVPAPGGALERTLDLPLPPFPGLFVGPLRVVAVRVCRLGPWDDTVGVELEMVGAVDVPALVAEGWRRRESNL